MLDLMQVFILGIVEGFTEFLPISSTAHLILASDVLKLNQTEYLKSFEIIIQMGAILSVVWLYRKSFWNSEVLKRVAVASVPTGIAGLLLYKTVKQYLMGNTAVVLWSLGVGGLFLILFERYFQEKKEETDIRSISFAQCLKLGIFQSVALVPGVSRAAATIIGGLWLGIPRKTIVEFSFLLAVPAILAASGLDIIKNVGAFNAGQLQFLAAGFAISFVMALISIRWLLHYVKNHSFTVFGVYRILLAILFLAFYL